MIERFSRPQLAQLQPLIANVLGPRASEEQVGRAVLSLLGQCLAYVTARPLIAQTMPGLLAGDDVVERVSRHIIRLTWGGLMALREEQEICP